MDKLRGKERPWSVSCLYVHVHVIVQMLDQLLLCIACVVCS